MVELALSFKFVIGEPFLDGNKKLFLKNAVIYLKNYHILICTG